MQNWDNCPALAQADLMMGDRLIEAPEYTLEQWRYVAIRSGRACRGAPAFSHLPRLRLTLCKFSWPNRRAYTAQQVFASLMDDATLTPLFNYHCIASAPHRGSTVFD